MAIANYATQKTSLDEHVSRVEILRSTFKPDDNSHFSKVVKHLITVMDNSLYILNKDVVSEEDEEYFGGLFDSCKRSLSAYMEMINEIALYRDAEMNSLQGASFRGAVQKFPYTHSIINEEPHISIHDAYYMLVMCRNLMVLPSEEVSPIK